MKKTLREYQIPIVDKGVTSLLTYAWYFMLVGVRSGKTFITLRIAKKLKVKHVLIVCPPKVIPHWNEEMKCEGVEYNIISIGQFNKQGVADEYIKIYGIPDLLVFDEIHQMRHNSNRTKNLLKLSKDVKYKIGMTGTPVDSSVLELFYIMKYFKGKDSPYGGNKLSFYLKYGSIKPQAVGRREVSANDFTVTDSSFKRCLEYFRETTYSFLSDKIKLPTQEFIEFKLTEKQRVWLKKLRNNQTINELDGENVELTALHKTSKAMQIAGGFYIRQDESITTVGLSFKYSRLLDLINEHKTRIIIWTQFIYEQDKILGLLKHLNLTSCKFNEENRIKFNQGGVDIMLCHPKSASTGVDISGGEVSIYVGHIPNSIDLIQSMYRMSVYGDESEKKIYHLVPEDKQLKEKIEGILAKSETSLKIFKILGGENV